MRATNVADVYPLTPLQEGILFHSHAALLAGAPDEYVRQFHALVRLPLAAAAFAAVWQSALDRHPVLRSAFVWEEVERPFQVVFRRLRLPVQVLDLAACSPDEEERLVAEFLAADRRRGFDLGSPPLLRLALLRCAGGVHRVVLTFHHLVLDGWSKALLFGEVAAHYRSGRPPAPVRPFRDYLAWLERQDLAAGEAFWRELLRGHAEPCRVETPPPAAGAGDARPAASARLALAEETTAALKGAARAQRLTLNTMAQGAWGALLGLYGGGDDVVFGATVSGRPVDLDGVERMVGVFINTLPVRLRLAPCQTVRGALAVLQRQAVEARQHDYTPLARIQRCSELPRGVPLFESIVVFESYSPEPPAADGAARPALRLERDETLGGTNYPLTLLVSPGRQLDLRLDHDPRRFDGATAARLLAHFARLLEEMAARPEAPLAALSPLSPAEAAHLVYGRNDTREETGGPEALAHRRFTRQAVLVPDHPAVVCGGERLTYRELDRRSARLARALRRRGIGPERRVALLLERSAEMVVAVLGVLRAGGAYVPLDPGHPSARLALLLEDAAPDLVLAQRAFAGRLPPAPVVCLDELETESAAGDAEPLPDRVEPGNLAYVLFTSGSTGRPKGVEVPHAALANLLATAGRRLPLGPGDVLLALTTLAFDIATLELLLPLVSGAAVAVARDEARDPVRLARLLDDVEATALQATPTTFQMLLETGWRGGLRLRLLAGGEVLERPLAEALLARSREVWNGYGPTETTIYSTWHRVAPGAGPVPIGAPLGNTRALVLDPWLRCVPDGVPGELYVGGDGVARGYARRPELTAEAFVPDPCGGAPGERLYRTGDRVRWLAGGGLEFLGRSDEQVKLRGHRIELGEVEQALREHPRVRQAAVLLREDQPGRRELAAYLVPRDGAGEVAAVPSADELRAFLRRRLPEPMVPALFVPLAAMPLTTSGKLDRRALPAPAHEGLAARYVAPRGRLEQLMAEVWSEVMGIERVGVHDNFFDLGGDSILAIRILARLGRHGVRLTPQQMFDLQTIALLAEAAGAADNGRAAATAAAALVPAVALDAEGLDDVLAELRGFAD